MERQLKIIKIPMFKEYLCLEIKENILAEGTPLAKLKF